MEGEGLSWEESNPHLPTALGTLYPRALRLCCCKQVDLCVSPRLPPPPPTSRPGVIHKPQAMPGHALFPMMNPPPPPQGRIWEALPFSFPDPFTAPGTEVWILSIQILSLQ